jgi:hypothetical protein
LSWETRRIAQEGRSKKAKGRMKKDGLLVIPAGYYG